MLTLYVLPCDNKELHKPEEAIESFGDIVSIYCKLIHRNIRIEKQINPITSEWYGYIFSDELLDENARKALPIYLEHGGFESLIIMRKELIEDVPKITQAPRIFHRSISLRNGTLLPEDTECRFERMLDGWIIPNNR